MYKPKNDIGWAKCWASQCEASALELIKSRQTSFNLVWYCPKHSQMFREQETTAKVIVKLKHNGHGNLTVVKREKNNE